MFARLFVIRVVLVGTKTLQELLLQVTKKQD
jgi:hypothetical protein